MAGGKQPSTKRHPGGRPRTLTDESKARIIEVLKDGCSRTVAAAIVGCNVSTIRNEALRDREFLGALKKAEAECEAFHIKRIKAGERAWQSSAWFLERKWSGRWARRDPAPPKPPDETEAIRVRAIVRALAAAEKDADA